MSMATAEAFSGAVESPAAGVTAELVKRTGPIDGRSLAAALYFIDRRGATPELRDFVYLSYRGPRSRRLDDVYGLLWDEAALSFDPDGVVKPALRLDELIAEKPIPPFASAAVEDVLDALPWRSPADATLVATVALLEQMHTKVPDEDRMTVEELAEEAADVFPEATLTPADVAVILERLRPNNG